VEFLKSIMSACKQLLRFAYAAALIAAVVLLTIPGESIGQRFTSRPRMPSSPGPATPNITQRPNYTLLNNGGFQGGGFQGGGFQGGGFGGGGFQGGGFQGGGFGGKNFGGFGATGDHAPGF
jgi:hypothetical protein